ncbi:MAG TPA: M28 family peptidase, partial [Rhodospirillales bacterium]|nr:M28 family peptidase [Rhodospirillales bacterium]
RRRARLCGSARLRRHRHGRRRVDRSRGARPGHRRDSHGPTGAARGRRQRGLFSGFRPGAPRHRHDGGRQRRQLREVKRGAFHAVLLALALFAAFVFGLAPVIGDNTDTLEVALGRHVRALAGDIGERSVLRGDGLRKAEDYVRRTFEAAGLAVSEQSYEYKGRRVANLIADLPGAGADAVPYIIGAHYDTVMGTPGADDNASAVAVMLELARRAVARPPGVALRFVAFTLEEPPTHATRHQGSRVFVRRMIEARDSAAGAIILEMVGLTTPRQEYPVFLQWAGYPKTGDFIAVVGNRRSRTFGEKVLAGMRRNPALPVESLFVWFNGWLLADTRLSDHAPFWDKGLAALMVTDTAYFRNPNYHGPGDKPETLDYAFMADLIESLELALAELAGGG